MMDSRPIIDLDGLDDHGDPIFHVAFGLPDPARFDPRLTSKQAGAIADFYGEAFPPVTATQAHALLSYRTYGRAVAGKVAPRASARVRGFLAHFVAAIVSQDDAVAADVVAWSDRAFDRGSERSSVGATKHFRWVADELEGHLAYLLATGADVLAL